MKKGSTEMKGTSIKAAVFAFASLCCSGLVFAGPDLGAAEQHDARRDKSAKISR